MSPDSRDTITWVLATIISCSVVVGLAVRFILMPYLREHLIDPMKQVKKQVTENHHSNQNPTVLDRIDDVQSLVEEIRDMQNGYMALTAEFAKHLNWSEAEVSRLWRAIGQGRPTGRTTT
jgi:hypothetical protein